MKHLMAWCAMGASVMVGCQSYQEAPIDWAEHGRSLAERAADGQAVRAFYERLAVSVDREPAPGDGAALRLVDAEAVALAYNPRLRIARAKAGVHEAAAAHAGLMADPELGIDVLRFTESVEKPWITGIGLSFTLPITNRLGVEAEAAATEQAQSLWAVAVEEWAVVGELRAAWLDWSAQTMRERLLEQQIKTMSGIEQKFKALVDAGELHPTAAAPLLADSATLSVDLLRARSAAERLRRRVLMLMGLLPDAPVKLVAALGRPAWSVDHADVLSHPRMARMRVAYRVAEKHLETEILKQYPDLEVGPVFEREEGQSRIGVAGGIPIPSINLNRKGIAEAHAVRKLVRVEAEAEYEHLINEIAAARAAVASAGRVRLAYAERVVPLVEAQSKQVESLVALGEVDVTLLRMVLENALEAKEQMIEDALAESRASYRLWSLLRPRWKPAVKQHGEPEVRDE